MQDDRRTILIVGQGVLASAVLDFLAQSEERDRIVIAARDPEKLNRRVNLARYTALNLGRGGGHYGGQVCRKKKAKPRTFRRGSPGAN